MEDIMTISRRIKLSNILMALLPIAAALGIVATSLYTPLGSFWYTWESMYRDENGIQSAQSLIYTYQQELWEYNWSQPVCSVPDKGLKTSEKMYHLENKLSGMGYHFQIMKNGNEIYSNMEPEDTQAVDTVAGEAILTAKTLTASKHDVSVIKNTFYHGTKVFSIIAVHRGGGSQQAGSYLQSYLLKFVVGFILIFLLFTVCVNWALSCWISRSVLVPLEKLERGTKEIREGNLDTEIDYRKQDEFGQVCQNFDEMRIHLKESVEQKLKDEKRKQELIAGISHDLRTPLTSIMGYVGGLLDGIADTPEKQTRYLKAIRKRAGDLCGLVENLSEYNKLENGSFHYQMEPVDLKTFIRKYLSSYEEEARRSQVAVYVQYPERECPVMIDQNEWKRVLDNLFTNTIRYRKKESSLVEITISLTGEKVGLIFADDGPGVPEDSLEAIFESFYRVDEARSHSEEGSGIGLAVVKEIVSGHGGTVRAENRNGLAMVIELPKAKESGT